MAKKTADASNLPPNAREQLVGLQQTSRRANRHKDQHADYSVVDPNLLLSAITKIAARGCAIQLGLTKDGSTFVIRIIGDGEPYNDFVRPSEDINSYFEALTADFTDGG
jgi:hypothetical protein